MNQRFACVAAALCLWSVAAEGQTLRIYDIDVDQGGATLFVSPGGHTLLVDAGKDGHGARIRAAVLRGERGLSGFVHLETMLAEEAGTANTLCAHLSDRRMSNLEFHVLLALATGPLYGYAIKDAVTTESGGTLTPLAGSLYRVIARLMSAKFVREAEPDDAPPPHPGLARRYYALTAAGRKSSPEQVGQRVIHSASAIRFLGNRHANGEKCQRRCGLKRRIEDEFRVRSHPARRHGQDAEWRQNRSLVGNR